ncbi:hypothetical protein MACJ_002054 [Theileria orientalis]|uniref:Uncharacterized protein n=1 Tax=Theileria orientalis TaxID=68886 RepID=A0A976M5J8_THEOR|nr:hypothetical protein MACJ_002054 [Theileria orientalis]
MDQNTNKKNTKEQMGQMMDEIPKHYPQHGYISIPEEQMKSPIPLYPSNQYVIQNVGHEPMTAHYIDGMEPAYICNYPAYEAGIPINTSIQQYRQSPFHSIASYEMSRPESRAMCNANTEQRDMSRFQKGKKSSGKTTHPCILNREEESQCVVQALNLIGTILNSRYSKEDSNALLICTRSAWNKAIESVGSDIASSFHSNKFNEFSQYLGNSQISSTEFVYNLLKHCFGKKLTKVNANNPCSTGESNDDQDLPRADSASDPDLISDYDEYESLIPSAQPGSNTNERKNGYNAGRSVDSMKRLLIRFVDELPTRKIVNGRLKNNVPVYEERSSFWNYIQAANEIAIHDGAVEYVVVASLSDIIMMSIPSYLRDGPDDSHPFASSLIRQGKVRHYQTKTVSMYTMALATTINAVNSRIKDLKNISELDSGPMPRFTLVESLPPQGEDATKFTKFISERFGSTHLLE